MSLVQVKTGQHISQYVVQCRLISWSVWSEEIDDNIEVWGLEVHFSNGEVVCFPDLCTRKSDVEELKRRLEGADLSPPFLKDVVEDYLGYIYGLH